MTTSLPGGYTARPATLDDVDIAVELANLCPIEWIGRPEYEAHEFRNSEGRRELRSGPSQQSRAHVKVYLEGQYGDPGGLRPVHDIDGQQLLFFVLNLPPPLGTF